jgi:hypothetical protein
MPGQDEDTQCVFCENSTVGAPPEHAWPDWICRFLTDDRGDWYSQVRDLDKPSVAVEHAGREIDLTVSTVCERCNHGWMRRLETKVAPFLKPMIVGIQTTLTFKQQMLLARWSAKTAIVHESTYSSTKRRTPRFSSAYLRSRGTPRGTQVVLGRYEGTSILDHTRASTPDVDGELHFSYTTLLIGQVFIQVFADPRRDSKPALTQTAANEFIALFRPNETTADIVWPPPGIVDDTLYGVISGGPNTETR